jgi:ribosomal protein S18 acetylase RimI-like enzyme
MPLTIRPALAADADAIWAVIEPAIRAGEVYTFPRDQDRAEAVDAWLGGDHTPFVAERDGAVVGSYYIRPNQTGGGSHVANGTYATSPSAGGQGVGRAMGEHSLAQARAAGFSAMQFNFVVSTNATAVRLWQAIGFEIVGRLPGAFRRPCGTAVDALVMYRTL